MTATDILAPQKVEQTLFALIATWLAKGTKDLVNDFPTITTVKSFRTFTFEGNTYNVVSRASGDLFITPGVNVYFGNHVPYARNCKPQIYEIPIMVHTLVPWLEQAMSASKLAMRISSYMEQAFEGSGALQQICDFSMNPPVPTPGRYVSWAHLPRGSSGETGDPTKGVFTNRVYSRSFRYAR